MFANYQSVLIAGLLLLGGSNAAAAEDTCAAPALGFLAGDSLHVSRALDVTQVGWHRISLDPYEPPPQDAFVPFEEHPDWGQVAIAVIVSAAEDAPEYLPIERADDQTGSIDVPALRDYFVMYLEKTAPAGSEFAAYLFGSKEEVTAGYHLVRVEEVEPDFAATIFDIDRPIRNNFEQGATPTGLNL